MSTFGSAAGIRAGQAFVEVGADTSLMQKQITDGVTKALNKSSGGIGTNLSVLRQLSEARWIDRIGTGLNQASAAALKLRTEFEAGEISAGEMTDKLLGALPFFGQFWQLGRNIRELFEGDNQELAKQISNLQEINSLISFQQKLKKETSEYDYQQNKARSDHEYEAQLAIQPEGSARDIFKAKHEYQEAIEKAEHDRLARRDKIIEDRGKELGLPERIDASGQKSRESLQEYQNRLTGEIAKAKDEVTRQKNAPHGEMVSSGYMGAGSYSTGSFDQDKLNAAQANLVDLQTKAAVAQKAANEVSAALADADAQAEQNKQAADNNYFSGLAKAGLDWTKSTVEAAQKWMKGVDETIKKNKEEEKEHQRKAHELALAQKGLADATNTPAENLKRLSGELDTLLKDNLISPDVYKRSEASLQKQFGGDWSSQGEMAGFDMQGIVPSSVADSRTTIDSIGDKIDRIIDMLPNMGFGAQ